MRVTSRWTMLVQNRIGAYERRTYLFGQISNSYERRTYLLRQKFYLFGTINNKQSIIRTLWLGWQYERDYRRCIKYHGHHCNPPSCMMPDDKLFIEIHLNEIFLVGAKKICRITFFCLLEQKKLLFIFIITINRERERERERERDKCMAQKLLSDHVSSYHWISHVVNVTFA